MPVATAEQLEESAHVPATCTVLSPKVRSPEKLVVTVPSSEARVKAPFSRTKPRKFKVPAASADQFALSAYETVARRLSPPKVRVPASVSWSPPTSVIVSKPENERVEPYYA